MLPIHSGSSKPFSGCKMTGHGKSLLLGSLIRLTRTPMGNTFVCHFILTMCKQIYLDKNFKLYISYRHHCNNSCGLNRIQELPSICKPQAKSRRSDDGQWSHFSHVGMQKRMHFVSLHHKHKVITPTCKE